MSGFHHTEETKRKLSLLAKTRFADKTKHPLYGKKHRPESLEKMRLIKLGKKASLETRLKMGLARKGKKRPLSMLAGMRQRMLGELNPMYGKRMPEELKQRIRMANKGKKFSLDHRRKISEAQRGEKNHNWQGGKRDINYQIRKSFEYKLWRDAVFKRDKYTCIWCGKTGGRLNADHIKPFALFPELRFSIDNGRTLCKECHKKTDDYGWKFYHHQKVVISLKK